MSDESHNETTDTKRLEMQIENLRCSIIMLIIVVSLLSIYIIIQAIQQYSFSFFINVGLFLVIALGILLLCAYSYASDKG
ncbi:MAG: hypothetical protein ACFFBL_08155 [Promethearchaeota archaeon]